ncbi:MAG: hypothetical protein PHP45_10975, partial [Elusimicrobiales bacterium]|nr:hypothetical protein [Elusimicrobiales bacterium]
QKYYWQDNGAQGSEAMTWIYAPGAVSNSLTKFAPTYSAGAASVLGKFFTLDADYVTTNLDSGTDKALGRLGAELWVIPGFLAGRGGVQSDFKNLSTYSNPKAMQYFLGAGVKLWALTVDAAAAYSQVTQGSDGGNFTGAVSGTLKF